MPKARQTTGRRWSHKVTQPLQRATIIQALKGRQKNNANIKTYNTTNFAIWFVWLQDVFGGTIWEQLAHWQSVLLLKISGFIRFVVNLEKMNNRNLHEFVLLNDSFFFYLRFSRRRYNISI